ncbi:hypothetical protein [Myxococcus phage Mx4 ts27htf-1hrm-1]|nr:hypothetical protein [Myxococcus phage Mx4 ts27htf-1hrm-1]
MGGAHQQGGMEDGADRAGGGRVPCPAFVPPVRDYRGRQGTPMDSASPLSRRKGL